MKTLVIHAADQSTDFLKPIYSDIKNCTVVSLSLSRRQFSDLVKRHDRIIFLGHGTEKGLIGPNNFFMDSRFVYLLRGKSCVYIWCNADVFVEKYNLSGFYTGMIISEYKEALHYSINCTYQEIDESNSLFAQAIKFSIDSPDMLTNVKSIYGSHEGLNRIINFNYNNLYEK